MTKLHRPIFVVPFFSNFSSIRPPRAEAERRRRRVRGRHSERERELVLVRVRRVRGVSRVVSRRRGAGPGHDGDVGLLRAGRAPRRLGRSGVGTPRGRFASVARRAAARRGVRVVAGRGVGLLTEQLFIADPHARSRGVTASPCRRRRELGCQPQGPRPALSRSTQVRTQECAVMLCFMSI